MTLSSPELVCVECRGEGLCRLHSLYTQLAMSKNSLVLTLIPAIFVVIWSTGWVVVLFVMPHADPLTFLSVRFSCAFVVVGLFALLSGAPIPRDIQFIWRAILSGVFIHGLYLSCVWWAIWQGVPSGISAIVSALQPLMTAVAAPYLLGERLSPIRICGIVLGFIGIVVALLPQLLSLTPGNVVGVAGPIVVNVLGMAALTGGTFYQKRALPTGDLRVIAALQFVGACLVTVPMALMIEPMHIEWSLEPLLALLWNIFGISVGGIALLLFLIRRGEVSRAATLIYMVPATAAVEIFIMKGILLTPIQLTGMIITVTGVALASRK